MHYIYAENKTGSVHPSRGHGVWSVPPREGGWSSGMVAGDGSRLHRNRLSAEDKTMTDSGLSELKPSGAETTRLDTGGDTKLTYKP